MNSDETDARGGSSLPKNNSASVIGESAGGSGVPWHFLDVGGPNVREIASALSKLVPLEAWLPQISAIGAIRSTCGQERFESPSLEYSVFPLQRGYSAPVLGSFLHEGRRVVRRIGGGKGVTAGSVLVITNPHYAEIAERWPGPVVYYLMDLMVAYDSFRPSQVRRLDRRIGKCATLACVISERIANYLVQEAGVEPAKVAIVPNGVREENLLPGPATEAGVLPVEISSLVRPVAGVIGNMAANVNWLYLEEVIDATPWLSWAFVGPVPPLRQEPRQAKARERVLGKGDRIARVGEQPYGRLVEFARSFDVAVLPYRRREPTYSGSSTRFWEHLAAGKPILSTDGFHELLSKEPMLTICRDPESMTRSLWDLRDRGFRDGHEALRWRASREATWSCRAADLLREMNLRMNPS